MTAGGDLVPRPDSDLARRSTMLAERALSELAVLTGAVLVLTRSCPYATELGRLAGDKVIWLADPEEASQRVKEGNLDFVVVGSDVVDWPDASDRAALRYRSPVLRWTSRAESGRSALALHAEPGGGMRLCVADWLAPKNMSFDLDLQHARLLERLRRMAAWWQGPAGRALEDDASFVRVQCMRSWFEAPDEWELSRAAVARRREAAEAWLATEEGLQAAEEIGGEVVVRGGRVALCGRRVGPRLDRMVEQAGSTCDPIDRLEGLQERLRDGEVDVLLASEGLGYREAETLVPVLGEAVRSGVPVLASDGPMLLPFRRQMLDLSSTLEGRPDRRSFGRALSHALLERKAWLFGAGRASEHLEVACEAFPWGGRETARWTTWFQLWRHAKDPHSLAIAYRCLLEVLEDHEGAENPAAFEDWCATVMGGAVRPVPMDEVFSAWHLHGVSHVLAGL